MRNATLDADRLATAAGDATGFDDFGEPTWREGLDRLLDALGEDARLNEVGEQVVAAEVTGYLTTRLGITDWGKRHPEVGAADVRPPIVIMGQGRTGTTILHDLLAQDPDVRVPLSWEVDRPLPPPDSATYETDPRIDEVQSQLDMVELVIPGFLSMHPMAARLAQECVRMQAGDFRSWIFPTQYRVPSYGRWLLDEADFASTYRWHRRFLEHLQSRHPARRWVLKSPGHIWTLPALLAEYPGALLVQTHRDPLRIVASLSSLVSVLRRLASDRSSTVEVAEEWVDYLTEGLDRSVTARRDGTVAADRVVDVQFRDFMADPWKTIAVIYGRLGLELTPETEDRMRAFLAANSQEQRGTHRYTWDATGLDAGAVRERVRPYCDFFDVPEEALP